MEISYLDICICLDFNQHRTIRTHFLAIPLHEGYIDEVILDIVTKALDVLCVLWHDIIIGISTDGEKMTDQVSEVATRFETVAKPGFIHIWCGAHCTKLFGRTSSVSLGRTELHLIVAST